MIYQAKGFSFSYSRRLFQYNLSRPYTVRGNEIFKLLEATYNSIYECMDCVKIL
jgi:hypothetical protein